MLFRSPDTRIGSGQYLFVANGNMQLDGRALPEWSMVYIEPDEAAFDITAGPVGLEALVMRFPVNDD